MRLRARLGFTVVAVLLVFAVTAFVADKGEALRGAAEKGDAQVQYILGLMYYKGYGVAKNRQEAVVWCRRAADQGHAQADTGQPVVVPSDALRHQGATEPSG